MNHDRVEEYDTDRLIIETRVREKPQSGQVYSRLPAKEKNTLISLRLMGYFSPLPSITLPAAAGSSSSRLTSGQMEKPECYAEQLSTKLYTQ